MVVDGAGAPTLEEAAEVAMVDEEAPAAEIKWAASKVTADVPRKLASQKNFWNQLRVGN